MPQFIDRDEYLSELLDDPRLNNVFSALCGENYNYLGSDANIFDCGTRWHNDSYGSLAKYINVKALFYLEPLTLDNGALRVIPGSHKLGDKFTNTLSKYLIKADDFEQDLGLKDHEIPCQVIPTNPGDVIVFDYRIKHATCYKGNCRRMLSIVASEHFQREDLAEFISGQKMTAALGYDTYYQNTILSTASPERMKHLQQLKDIDIASLRTSPENDIFMQNFIKQREAMKDK